MKELGIKLKIDGDISNILDSLKHLKNAFDTVEMPDKMAKDLMKSIDTAIQKVGEFGRKSESAIGSLSDSKEVSNAWKSVEKILDALQVKLGNVDVTKLFPKEVVENLEKAEASAKEYNRALTEAKGLDAYKSKLEELNQIVEKQKVTQALAKKAEQEAIRAEAVYAKEKAQWTEDVNKAYEAQQQKIDEAKQKYEDQTKAVKELVETQKQLQAEGYLTTTGTVSKTKLKIATELGEAEKEEKDLASKFSSAKGQVTKYKNKNAGKDLSKDQKYLDLVQKQTKAQEELNKAQAKTKALREQLGDVNKLNQAKNISADLAGMRATAAEFKKEAEAAESAGSALAKQRKELEDAEVAYNEASADVQAYGQSLEDLETKQKEINEQLKSIQTSHAEKEWEDLTEVIKEFTGIDLSQSEQDIEKVNQAVADYKEGKIKDLPELLAQILANAAPIGPAMQGVSEGLNEAANSAEKMADAEKEIENLKNQIVDFFSIGNSIQLFKRAITSAMNTVKELDATMTEAAVVTEFDIGDMWDRLPQYSTQAKELGVSINSMYEATTLYYQQGLKTNEAMELGVETMKMAKIAGMDSTNATKAMTSALRGFNMELNETSAQRVNDVYSQLAAVTAADTNQIATAMEKTASIAASANMEFETTAAFLSQIIETTQEAPETAGTALKTIIARFAEVKSLREQGKTTGEDEEGEAIDVNKIQAALRTVGISMEGFFAGTEGLDSVLLKLAEKWGNLGFETQRYIATMAAGSRQQSRFIAMMSDYQRTTELVAEANNSAGASQKQYEKTLDSLETKLQNLKNAWDEFAMGLANNELLKAGVDILTGLLNVVNKTTEAISGGNGLVKSITSLAMVLSTLKIGKSILGGAEAGGAIGGILGKFGLASKGEGGERKSIWAAPGEKAAERRAAKETEGGGVFQRPIATKKISRNGYNDWEKNTLKKRLDKSIKKEKDPQKQKELQELRTSLDETGADVDKVKNKFGELGGNIKKLGTETEETALDLDNVGASMSKLGGIMMATGAATSLLATLFDSMGMEEEAETVRTLGAVLLGLGTVLTTLGSFLPTLTGLTAAQAAATWAALWPILLVVAALGALIAVIVLFAKHKHDISLEGRMQAAAEATERAKEAAEGAKQAYDDLLSDKSEYDTLQEKLDTLTKGTLEWKQALADSNAQVLELLDTYPELANYLTRGEHGELEITEKGWEIVQERQAQAVRNSNAAVVSSQIQETKLQQEKIETNLTEAAGENYLYGSARWDDEKGIKEEEFTQEQQLDIIYEAYKKDPTIFQGADPKNNVYSEALTSLSKQLGVEAWQIYKMRDALVEYDQAMTANEVTLQAQSEALLASAASAETNAYEYGDEIIAGFAKGASENQKTKEDAIKNDLTKQHKDEKGNEIALKDTENFKKMAADAGVRSTELNGEKTHDLEVLYAAMAGIGDVENIDDGLKGNAEKLAAEIAKMQAAKEEGQDVDKVAEKMRGLDKVTQKEYAAMISGDVDLMDQNIITKYGTVDDKEVEKIASDLGLTTAQLAEKMGVAENELAGALEETAKTAGDAFNETKDEIVKIAGEMPKYLGKASLGGLKKYAALLSQAAALGTKDTIQAGFDAIFNSNEITEAQKSKIVAALDTFDWTKEGEGERFLEFLKTIGVDIEGIVPNMEAFTTGLKTVDALLKKIDVKSVFDELTNGLQEARDVADQDKLTNEQYFKYLKEGLISEEESGEWTYDGEGWVNVTNGMGDLVEALKNNTLAQLKTRRDEAQGQVDWYNRQTNAVNSFNKSLLKKDENGKWVTTGVGLSEAISAQTIYQAAIAGKATEKQAIELGFTDLADYQRWYDIYKNDTEGKGHTQAQAIVDYYDDLEKKGFNFDSLFKEKDLEDYDNYYSEYEKLAALAREREKLEKQRNKLLEAGNADAARAEREKQIQALRNEKIEQEAIATGKSEEIQALLNEKQSDYASRYGFSYDSTTGEITFDESKVNADTNETRRNSFSEFITSLEGLRDQWREATDGVEEAVEGLEELYDEDRQAYIDATTEIREAIISEREKEIDALREVNDSINDANSRMIEAMQSAVDKYRQDRDNERTESDIEDKWRRLAYLQQDTSGANATEILQLQKEIEQDQETYTDSLIDQKIQELQDQNDKAAEQRERQIQILEALLEHDQESGKIWGDVEDLLDEAFAGGSLNMDSELVRKMKEQADFDQMSSTEQGQWLEQTRVTLTNAYSLGQIVKGNSANSTYTAPENTATFNGTGKLYSLPKERLTANQIKTLKKGLNDLLADGKLSGFERLDEASGNYDEATKTAVKELQGKIGAGVDGFWGPETYKKFRSSNLTAYKTGGLADFTGPAWLDGTKSKPEYILNANQTRAFFQLVDVLSGLEHASTNTTQNNGDINLDIDINVETINDTADLDTISSYIEEKIVASANYRNNNIAGRSR